MRMDRAFTPREDRPRSTPEPLPSFHNLSDEPPENVVTVQPVNGQVTSDAVSLERNAPGNAALGGGGSSSRVGVGGRREMFNPVLVNSEGGGGDEREESGRPSSAPARTPNSADHVLVYAAATASMTRPRNVRPHHASVLVGDVDSEMPSLDPALMPASRHEQAGSSEGAESGEQHQESFLQQYSELSPGPSGEPHYMCHFCTFSTEAVLEMRAHLMRHGNDLKMKCTQCGYITEERTQFRRHRRQHQRTNPTSMLHCDKCQFSTPAPRRMREHYSFQHNEEMAATFPSAAAASSSVLMRSAAFNATPGGFGRLAYGSESDYYTVNVTGRGLNSYRLPPPRSNMQFDPGTPSSTIVSGCANGGFTQPMGFPAFRNHNDRRGFPINHQTPLSELTLEYLFGPRVSASSTITSCEYPARPSNPHRPDLNNFSPLRGSTSGPRDTFARQTPGSPNRNRCSMSMQEVDGGVKVKTEPIDCDGVSDVSSSGVPGLFERGGPDPDRPQRSTAPEATTTHSRYHRRPLFEATTSPQRMAMEQSDEIATSGGGDVSRVSQSSEAASSHMDTRAGSVEDSEQEERRESGGGGGGGGGVGGGGGGGGAGGGGGGGGGEGGGGNSLGHHLLYSIKAETSNVAVQCSGSSSAMKSESLPLVTVAAAEHSTESRPHHRTAERGVQCEILSPPHRRTTASSRNLSTDSEQHESLSGADTRCMHCGITFEDEVLFSIHLGCHSHTDPFVCNVCGKKCHNKYGFYSHIMRGHHY